MFDGDLHLMPCSFSAYSFLLLENITGRPISRMALISLQNVSIGFRGPSLLDDVSCQIEAGGRIGLLGRNGAGKSTLLKMLRGDIQPDHGTITLAGDTHVAYLQQDVPRGANRTVAQVTAAGLSDKYRQVESAWEGE